MTRSTSVLILAGIAAVNPERLVARQALPEPGVYLSIDQRGSLTDQEIELAVDEVRQIWKGAGVVVSSGGTGSLTQQARVSVRVLTMPLRHRTPGRIIMGWVTHGGGGSLTPMMFISLSGITDVLNGQRYSGMEYRDLPTSLRSRITARTVGRVAAHELGHYLLQTTVHGHNGLMRREFLARELGDPGIGPFLLPPREAVRLRRELIALGVTQAEALSATRD